MADLGCAEIMTAAVTECAPDWSWDSFRSSWRHLILWMVTAGQGTINHAERVYQVRAGDCYVFRMWRRCVGAHDPKLPLTVHWCEFRYVNSAGEPVSLPEVREDELPLLHRRPPDLSFLTKIFDRAIQYSRESGRKAEADLWMEATLQELHRQDALLPRSGLELAHFEAIQELKAAIHRDVGRPWSVREMARHLHYSPDHFTRVFRAVCGESPREFLVRTRMEEAKQLISMSSFSIGRIADLLGYSDIYHFSKQFKEKMGVSPSRFRVR